MFWALEIVFGGTECIGSVFMICDLGLVFGGTEGVGSCFHVLHALTQFRPYRGRRVPFSCFSRPDSFLAIPRASGPVFMFCAPGIVFAEGVGSCFHVFASGLVFCGTEGVGYRFHVLRSRNRFRRCLVRRFPFLCFALPDSFSSVPSASGPVFMFCAVGLIFGGTEALGHVFKFCARALIFDGTEGVGSRFHVLRLRTRFRRYVRRRVQFSCFARPESFSAVTRALGPVFMFCASRLIFGDNEGFRSRFHVFRSRPRFR
jgi:hypothetical protein